MTLSSLNFNLKTDKVVDMKFKEEENDEGPEYIDPNDLDIIEDPNWEPTPEQIISYANQLGMDTENDPEEFLQIAYASLKEKLPDNEILKLLLCSSYNF